MWNWKERHKEKPWVRSADATAHGTAHILRRTAMTQSALIGQSIHFKGELQSTWSQR
jgi:hypothetical protein